MSRRKHRHPSSRPAESEDLGLKFLGLNAKEYNPLQLEQKTEQERRILATAKLQSLSDKDFEKFIAQIFQIKGYRTVVRGGAGDHGVDVEAHRDGEYLVIQCKQYANSTVKPSQVRDLGGVVQKEKATQGILVTTGDFTQQGYDWARDMPIDLVNLDGIIGWLKIYKIGPWHEEKKPEPDPRPTTNEVEEPLHLSPDPRPTANDIEELLQPSKAVFSAQAEPALPQAKAINFPTPTTSAMSVAPPRPKKLIFTCWQWIVLLMLIGPGSFISCAIFMAMNAHVPAKSMPPIAQSQAHSGLIFSVVQVSPFVSTTIQPSGHFWQIDLKIDNPTRQPVVVRPYDIFLRDQAGNEIQYHYDLTIVVLKNLVVPNIQPGATVRLSMVYDIPSDHMGDISVNYDGAQAWFNLNGASGTLATDKK